MISEDMRLRLAQSMPGVERRRAMIVAKIAERIVPPTQGDERPSPDVIAAVLFDLLISSGSDIAAFAGLRDLSGVRRSHDRLGVSGRQYSRFGLALGPALKSVLGVAMSPDTVNAWCDAFWLVVGAIASDEPRRSGRSDPQSIGRLAGA